MSTITQFKTKVERWADKITGAHSKSVEAIIEVGRLLIQAKADCSRGEWGHLTGQATGKCLLPFSRQTAQYMMSIAKNPAIANSHQGGYLPASWRTLAVLAALEPEDIEKAIADGDIYPEMQRKDAYALKMRVLNEVQQKPPAPDVEARRVAPIQPTPFQELTEEQREVWQGVQARTGEMIADYADRMQKAELISRDLSAMFPVQKSSACDVPPPGASESAKAVITSLAMVADLLTQAPGEPVFGDRRGEALRLARNILNQLEKMQ